jgi:hypothetical protein
MANRAKAKGTFAENCVRDHLQSRYADRVANGAGHVWHNVTQGGAKDTGDILGPHTAIEVKNYSNPPESALLDNAQGKGVQSGMRHWFLVYKAKGRGERRVGEWHALTTVGHLMSPAGWGLGPRECSAQDFLVRLPELCASRVEIAADFTAPAYGEQFPQRPWTARLICSNFMARRQVRRDEFLSAHRESAGLTSAMEVPFVVSPRSEPAPGGKAVMRPAKDWYAYAKFDDFIHALEAVGVMPQSEDAFTSILSET